MSAMPLLFLLGVKVTPVEVRPGTHKCMVQNTSTPTVTGFCAGAPGNQGCIDLIDWHKPIPSGERLH
jgi:hypothetical protein